MLGFSNFLKLSEEEQKKVNLGIKYAIIAAIIIAVVLAFLPFGAYYYLLYTYTDYRVIAETESLEKFPEEWTIHKGKIINTARENYVFPDDPLEYQVRVDNPKDEDRKLMVELKIFKGGDLVGGEVITRNYIVRANEHRVTDFPIFLHEEGTYNLKIRLVFDMQIPGSVHPNWTFNVDNIQVQSLSNKLLADANHHTFWSYVSIFGIAAAGNIGTIIYLRKQHRQTKQQLRLTQIELESRLRAEIEVSVMKSELKKIDDKNWEGMISVLIRNQGTVSARNVKVHFKDPTSSLELPQLIRDEDEIKKTFFPIPGSIQSKYYYPKEIPHRTSRTQSGVYDVAIWITYDYGEVKNMELIQIVTVNAQAHSEEAIYEKADIEQEKKRQKNQGL